MLFFVVVVMGVLFNEFGWLLWFVFIECFDLVLELVLGLFDVFVVVYDGWKFIWNVVVCDDCFEFEFFDYENDFFDFDNLVDEYLDCVVVLCM